MAHKQLYIGVLYYIFTSAKCACWSEQGLTDTVISVGPPGRGLGFHNHGSTFEAVVSGGSKHFSLLPPIAAEAIAAARKNNFFYVQHTVALFIQTRSLWGWLHCPADERGGRDLFQRLLLPAAAHRDGTLMAEVAALGLGAVQRCTVFPGEAIFIPCNWYHATENLPQQSQQIQQQDAEPPPPAGNCDADGSTTEAVTPTIAIAMQWSSGTTMHLDPRGRSARDSEATSSAADFCPADAHADFRQLFQHAVRIAGAGQTAPATQLLERACSYTPIFVHCTVGVARLYMALGRAEDARKHLLDGAAQYRALKEAGVIDNDVLTTVLGLVASEMDANLFSGGTSGTPSSEDVWSAYEAAAAADADGLDPVLQMRWARTLLGVSRELRTATTEMSAPRQQQGGLAPPVSEEQHGHEHTQTWPMQVRMDRAETAIAKARHVVQGLGVTSFYYQPPTTIAFDEYALEQALVDTEEELARSKWWWLWLHQWWYRWW